MPYWYIKPFGLLIMLLFFPPQIWMEIQVWVCIPYTVAKPFTWLVPKFIYCAKLHLWFSLLRKIAFFFLAQKSWVLSSYETLFPGQTCTGDPQCGGGKELQSLLESWIFWCTSNFTGMAAGVFLSFVHMMSINYFCASVMAFGNLGKLFKVIYYFSRKIEKPLTIKFFCLYWHSSYWMLGW